MQTQSRYLGVDVSKDLLVVVFERHRWQFANSKSGYAKFIGQIRKQPGPIHVVCEATGPYHLAMCLALQEAGIAFTISNPAGSNTLASPKECSPRMILSMPL